MLVHVRHYTMGGNLLPVEIEYSDTVGMLRRKLDLEVCEVVALGDELLVNDDDLLADVGLTSDVVLDVTHHLTQKRCGRRGRLLPCWCSKDFVTDALNQRNPVSLASVCPVLRMDREVVLLAVTRRGKNLEHAPDFYKADREVVLAAVSDDGGALQFAATSLQKDREVVMTAVQKNGLALHFVHPSEVDEEVCAAAVMTAPEVLPLLPPGMVSEKLAKDAMAVDGRCLEFLGESLRASRDVVHAAVCSKAEALRFAAPHLQDDDEIVNAALLLNPEMLQAASERIRSDIERVTSLVEEKPEVYQWAAPRLREDRDLALLAVDGLWQNLRHVSPHLAADPEVVEVAVRSSPAALQYADLVLRADRPFALLCVDKAGDCLEYLHSTLQGDSEVVLRALKSGGSCRFADPSLLASREFALEVLDTDISPKDLLSYIDPVLMGDKEVVLKVLAKKYDCVCRIAECLWADKEVVLAAARVNGKATLDKVDSEMGRCKDVLLTAIENNPECCSVLPSDVQHSKEVLLRVFARHRSKYIDVREDAFDDPDVFMAAARIGAASLHDHKKYRSDAKAVLAALEHSGEELQFASERLRRSKAIVLAACSGGGAGGLQYAHPSAMTREAVVLAVAKDGTNLKYVPPLLKDKETVLAAVRSNPAALKYAEDHRLDREVVVAALEVRPRTAIPYIDPSFYDDAEIRQMCRYYTFPPVAPAADRPRRRRNRRR
eukprot:Sspe_Gene.5623::Locus_1862_Transcript_1_1_Confidence_1.000_Length_2312::g.5623::m.5623